MARPKTVMLVSRDFQQGCFAAADLARMSAATDLRTAATDGDPSPAQQAEYIAGAEFIVTGWGTQPISTAMLDAAPDLRCMFHTAGSVKHLVNEEFLKRGIRVFSAAHALAVGVAEFAFGMMLVSMKAAFLFHDATREGRWDRAEHCDWVRESFGATLGIVGASHVGRHMIRLCQTLELEAILLSDPYVTDAEARELGTEKVDLDELMRRSDVVSLHTPATKECRHIINAERLAMMKDHAIFINTARGMCVDEQALLAELQQGRIWACLDVTFPEPPVTGSPFYALPNCVLTPHIAGSIKENRLRQGRLVADQIEAAVRGELPPFEVPLRELSRIA